MEGVKRNGDWIEVYDGKLFWPLDPKPEDIDIRVISHALSLQCRFGGHTRVFYSVGSHSVFVSRICAPADELWGLLHDASEAYLYDVARPLKKMRAFKPYLEIEANLMRVICERYGLNPEMPKSVKYADDVALATEGRDLMAPSERQWSLIELPSKTRIIPVSPEQAEKDFLNRFKELGGR